MASSNLSNAWNPSTLSDVAIVGAGPAGARAAYVLARAGARVTLFDPSHPREKPCGGGVTGRALALVADAIPASEWPATVIRSARFIDSTRGAIGSGAARLTTSTATPFASAAAPRSTRRCSTPPNAPARGWMRSRVLDVSIDRDGVSLETSDGPRRAAFVIGADGANSLVRRRVSQRIPPRSAVDRHRLLRAWRHQRRDRHRAGGGPARLPLVVSTAGPSGDRHLRPGRRRRHRRHAAGHDARLDRNGPESPAMRSSIAIRGRFRR